MPAAERRDRGAVAPELVGLLRCPHTHGPLELVNGRLVSADRSRTYEVSRAGIPLFADRAISREARIQQTHYDDHYRRYLANQAQPHIQEYTSYLDRAFLAPARGHPLRRVAEICCGAGEALELLGDRCELAVGLDVSEQMLTVARERFPGEQHGFVQGDATCMPFRSDCFDAVFLRGGIHHVPDREALFREIYRILVPGGRLFYLEPVDDFLLWRWLRAVIYRVSPALDHRTESPLRHRDTVPVLEKVGFVSPEWATFGALGFCLFMNSDVLLFNRVFRFVPGIRAIVRGATRIDERLLGLPAMKGRGLQVVGAATKPRKGGSR